METIARAQRQQFTADVKQRISPIYMKIKWIEVAHDYFGKSASWLYHKLDGIDGNGGKGGFTDEELSTLKYALSDLSLKMQEAANNL